MAIFFGILIGLVLAGAIAYMIVAIQAKSSNVQGDSMGGFKDFSKRPMQYIRSEHSRKLDYQTWMKKNHYQ